jgi:hypothetical protein
MFEFVFRRLAEGDTALTAGGIGALPAQLADALPAGSIRTNSPAAKVKEGKAVLVSGEEVPALASRWQSLRKKEDPTPNGGDPQDQWYLCLP